MGTEAPSIYAPADRDIAEFTLSVLQPARTHCCAAAIQDYVQWRAGQNTSQTEFWGAIRNLQHRDLPAERHEAGPQLVWYEGSHDAFAAALSMLMGGVDVVSEADPYRTVERSYLDLVYRHSLERFSVTFPRTYDAFCEVIAFVVLARRAGHAGGTVSSRIGLMWLAPEKQWTEDVWLENMIHEYVHNCLFLEDMVDPIFAIRSDRLEREDALAISAIRQVKRGYDKSYHSAFVAFTLAEFYSSIGRPEAAALYVNPLMDCLQDLIRIRHFAMVRGIALLVELADRPCRCVICRRLGPDARRAAGEGGRESRPHGQGRQSAAGQSSTIMR